MDLMLKTMFQDYNKRLFKNKLPDIKVIFSKRILKRCWAYLSYGEKSRPYIVIDISLFLKPECLIKTLIHEMIHLYQWKKYVRKAGTVYCSKLTEENDNSVSHNKEFQRVYKNKMKGLLK